MTDHDRLAHELAEELRNVEPGSPGLADGAAGLAVAFDRFDERWPGEGYGAHAQALLRAAAAEVIHRPGGIGLYSGATGVAWAIAHLRGRPAADVVAVGDRITALVLQRVQDAPWTGPYDLVGGLVGVGVLALERIDEEVGRAMLEATIDRLGELAVPGEGISWLTPVAHLPETLRARAPQGLVNTGVAHGVAGVVALLGAATGAGVGRAGLLLADAVRWLLAQEVDGRMPTQVISGTPSFGRDAGWCYGDPGLAVALLGAARGAGHADWESLAVRRARACGALERAWIVDASLCHGSAGMAHALTRIAAATGDDAVGTTAAVWRDRIEEQRPVGAGVLEGTAGVALALLAGSEPSGAGWDRFLMVSAPGES